MLTADPAEVIGSVDLAPVIVGVEGADAGLVAARWAAAEAVLRNRPLRVVHSFPPSAPPWSPPPGPPGDAESILAEALEAARSEAPQVPVTRHASTSPAAETLIDLSAQAYLVVIGHRGHGFGSPLRELRSPVASRVAAAARGPVAVVRAAARPHTRSGPIVVGVDGSTASGVALDFAFEEAALRHRALHVVRAWPHAEPAAKGTAETAAEGRAMDQHLPTELDQVERQLCEWVRPWRERYPHLPVTFAVIPGRPMCALAEESQRASLLVVGARGEGGQRHPLGSVSQQLVHLAACPVVVIRAPVRAAAEHLPRRQVPKGASV